MEIISDFPRAIWEFKDRKLDKSRVTWLTVLYVRAKAVLQCSQKDVQAFCVSELCKVLQLRVSLRVSGSGEFVYFRDIQWYYLKLTSFMAQSKAINWIKLRKLSGVLGPHAIWNIVQEMLCIILNMA